MQHCCLCTFLIFYEHWRIWLQLQQTCFANMPDPVALCFLLFFFLPFSFSHFCVCMEAVQRRCSRTFGLSLKIPRQTQSCGGRGFSGFSLSDGISLSTEDSLVFIKRPDEEGDSWLRNGLCAITCQEIHFLKENLHPSPSDPFTPLGELVLPNLHCPLTSPGCVASAPW